jgi:hypothetical protein
MRSPAVIAVRGKQRLRPEQHDIQWRGSKGSDAAERARCDFTF